MSDPEVKGAIGLLGDLTKGVTALSKSLHDNPALAQGSFAGLAAGTGGIAAAGATALTVAALGTLSLPALTIGSIAALTIGTFLFPWDKLYEKMGWKPGVALGGKDTGGVTLNPGDELPGLNSTPSRVPQVPRHPASPLNASDELPGVQKQSFLGDGFRSLVQNAAFGSGGANGPMADAVYSGVLRAFNELLGKGGGGTGGFGGGGIVNASFNPGGMNDNVIRALNSGAGRNAFGGVDALGGSGSLPGIPSSVAMSADERNKLGLILKYESGGRNVPNYVNDRHHTAQGFYQLTNTNWRRIAPLLGITARNAMSASFEDQTRVAQYLLHHSGVQNWSNFNPRLRGALGRGEHFNPVTQPVPTAGPPPKQQVVELQPIHLHADGRMLASVVTKRQAKQGRFPGSTGGPDTFGSHHGPATLLTDTA